MLNFRQNFGEQLFTHSIANRKKIGKLTIATNNSKDTLFNSNKTITKKAWHVADCWKSVEQNGSNKGTINLKKDVTVTICTLKRQKKINSFGRCFDKVLNKKVPLQITGEQTS